ncbi:ABC transporter ATP-binding protein/permease [Chlamydiales bacterium]|nr:ABC transporter ATP-binding protein/permease [Chlamydiales bacterium]
MFKLLYQILNPYKLLFFLGVLSIVLAKILETLIPFLIGHIVTQFTLSKPLGYTPYSLFFIIILSLILEFTAAFLRNYISEKGIITFRESFFNHILNLPFSFFHKARVGKLLTQTIHDVDKVREMIADASLSIIGNLVIFISIFIGALYVNFQVAIALSLLIPLTGLLFITFRHHQKKQYDALREALSEQNTFFQEHLMGHSTIRFLSSLKKELNEFLIYNNKCYKTTIDTIKTYILFITSIDFLLGLVWVIAFFCFVLQASPENPFEAGSFYTFTLWGLMFFRPLADLAERYNILLEGIASLKKINTVLVQKQEQDLGTQELKKIDKIQFEKVSFSFDEKKPILKEISLTLEKNQTLGLLGMTGAGKSTLINLLLRFYKPTKGSIKINDIDIENYTLSSLRKEFSLTLQNPFIFRGSVESNIQFRPSGKESTIDSLGKNLSEGEKQLISIKRASHHNGSCVLLDEATASIDPQSENAIQKELKTIFQGKTALIIAHRLTTLKNLDQLILLHHGKIIERGTFKELLAKKGAFYHLWQLQ